MAKQSNFVSWVVEFFKKDEEKPEFIFKLRNLPEILAREIGNELPSLLFNFSEQKQELIDLGTENPDALCWEIIFALQRRYLEPKIKKN